MNANVHVQELLNIEQLLNIERKLGRDIGVLWVFEITQFSLYCIVDLY